VKRFPGQNHGFLSVIQHVAILARSSTEEFRFTGIGAGAGVATGLQAGVCLAVEAAKEQGLITAAQVDQALNATGEQLASTEIVWGCKTPAH
jgi:hypothetical protein